uniref:Cytochrome P450 n=1 Tax=Scoparia dulcis TaxID=107240 RepID=A0A1W7HBX0_SCODU
MEVHSFSPCAVLVSLFLFILMISILMGTVSESSRNPGPPGPRKLPFIGNLHLLASRTIPPHHMLRNLAKKYGPVMHLQLGEISTLVISSKESAEEVLKTHDLAFASRPSLLGAEILFYGCKDLAFSPYGEYWIQMRKITALQLLGAKQVQSLRRIREKEALNLCGWIASNAGSTIHLSERLITTNYDILCRSSLGEKSNEHEKLLSIIKEAVEALGGFDITDLYPTYKLLHLFSGLKGRLERIHTDADQTLEHIIHQHKQAAMNAYSSKVVEREQEETENLLDVLLKLQKEGAPDLDQVPLTTENIKAMILVLFFAGSEATSTTLDWAMSEMLKNPSILKRAQQEVRKVLDENLSKVDETFLDKLMYLKLVIKETLRLHPPAPLLLPRECMESSEVSGYKIPVKTRVMINTWAIGRDPRYWQDAESFIPERFLESNVDYKGNDFEFIPFGAGRRMCPGMVHGLVVVEFQLALLLYHFDWSLVGSMKPEDIDMTETFGASARRKNRLYVIPTVMRPLAVE